MADGPNPFDAKYAPGAEQARQDVMVGVSVAMTLIGVTCVALRVYTRGFIVKNMGIEDWTMVAAATLTIVFLLELVAGAKEFKLGFSAMNLTPDQMVSNIQLILAVVVVYKMTVTLIKISILMIYLRIAVTRTFERLCKMTIYLLMACQVIVIIVVPAQCSPLRKLWDFTGQVQGHCINANAFYHAASAFHIVMDLWILVLPIKVIMLIPRPPREKLALFVIFGLGVVSTAAAIIRLQSLRVFTLSNDPFYDSLPINTWSMVEVNIGILCASIPTLKPLVSMAQRHRTKHALMKYSDQKDAGGGQWAGESKVAILQIGKDMLISLHPSTFKGDVKEMDEEWELGDRPPPPPPKDEKFGALQQAMEYQGAIKYPDAAFRKI
ncbi:hypothetical protein FB567DRAFT_209900 [Paraphoma chrysanthemicola]|uniref:Rhodopsin domain-containing protein n=1 Tax=Paraphoma chrysanthemicola TaxID=798071 RepID=A0A8K0VSG9_9PLEO|nr:hypothetical protein FB567DRAFT_209900 [Paraphoma chrysanthemicola]